MKKFVSIVAAAFVGFVALSASASAQTALKPIPNPTFETSASDGWKWYIIRCYEQANERRAAGLDSRPIFRTLSGQDMTGLPPVNGAFKCHVAGSDELAAKK